MKNRASQLKRTANEPYLPVINYRLGNYAKFKKDMIAMIDSKESLKHWTNRDRADWGIILFEMWAHLGDILCYYQERIFSEALVRTSVLDESVINLMYGINYKQIHGTAASSVLFIEANDEKFGLIPRNFRVQSDIPGDDGALEFVTQEEITITHDGNMMKLSDSMVTSDLLKGTTGIDLDRIYDELEAGDFLLIRSGTDHEIVKIEEKHDNEKYTTIRWSPELPLVRNYSMAETHIFKFAKTVKPFGHDVASKTNGIIRGTIQDTVRTLAGDENDPIPLSNTTIELLDATGKRVVDSDQTDKFGSFVFLNVYPGGYKLRLKRIDDLDVPRRWDKVDSSVFNLTPSNEMVLDVLVESLEFVNDLEIDMRQKITVSTKSNQSTNYMQMHLLSSSIYLDDEYPTLKQNSFLILIDEKQNSSDLLPEIYRIGGVENKYHAQFGAKKTVTHLSLSRIDDSKIFESVFKWDWIPVLKESETRTMKNKFKKYLMKKIRSKSNELQEDMASQAQDTVGSALKDAQSLVPESISDATSNISDSVGEKISEKIETESDMQKENFDKNMSRALGINENIITDENKIGIEKLRIFLKEKLSLDWIDDVSDEDIARDTSGDAIGISTDEHFVLFNLDKKNSRIDLYLDDQRSFDLSIEGNDGMLDVYWDTIYDSQLHLLTTKILSSPTFEIKTKPNTPSLKKTLNENQLVLEGQHTHLEPGSRLLITDNTSNLSGQLMSSDMTPLPNYKIRLYAASDEKSFLEKLKTKFFEMATDGNGNFNFDSLHSNRYKLAAYLPIPAYWSMFLNNVISANDVLIIQKTMDVVIRNSAEPIERTMITSSKITENLLYVINEFVAETMKSTPMENSINHSFLELLQKFNYASKYSTELINAVKDVLFFQSNENEKKTDDIFEIITGVLIPKMERVLTGIREESKLILDVLAQRNTENIHPLLLALNRTITTTTIIGEALRLITITIIESTINQDRNECRIGGTSEFLLDPDTDVTFHLTSDLGRSLSYSKIREELRSPEIIRTSNIAFKYNKTFVTLSHQLQNSYVVGYTQVKANLVPISFGQITHDEILGSGNSDLSSQKFALNNAPLTYTPSHIDPSGIQSTLEIFVDAVKWHEQDDFFMSKPSDRHYVTSIDENGISIITFGDGVRGARIPSGVDNIRATYRVGLGAKANLGQNHITNPVDTHPSIKSITNPVAATGGYRKHPVEQKSKMLSYVSSMGNAVTLQDYSDLAKTATYIAKAQSFQAVENGIPLINLVVAPLGGLPLDSLQKSRLRKFLDGRRDVSVPLKIISFKPVPIDLVVQISVDENYEQSAIVSSLISALRPGPDPDNHSLFSFEELDFGTDISQSDIYDVIGNVPGIKYSIINRFRRRDSENEIDDRVFVTDNEIIQCEDDPLDPSRGTIKIIASGGA